MSNKELATDVLELVGGKENVKTVVHCATRLRFQLADESKANTEALKNHTGVIQVVQSGGQYQVVIGSHVNEVYGDLVEVMGGEKSSTEGPSEKKGVVATFIDVISGIFTPFIPVLAGTGVLKGILSFASFLKPEITESGTYAILNAAGDGFFKFLPIAVAFTAAKKFKANQFIAVAIAMAMVYPFETTEGLNFFGLPVIYGAGYASTVFPIIMAVFVQQYVEKFARKFVPKVLMFGVPLITLLVMVPLTFIVIGPLGVIIGSILSGAISALYNVSPIVTGLVLGALWQVLVMFGMHWGLVPLAIQNLGTNGFDILLPLVIPAVIAQAGASFGVMLKTKDINMKGLASSSVISAIFGITEPAVYGVTVPLKKPFIYACIGGAIGGAINGLFKVKAFAFSTSVLILPNMIGRNGVESSVTIGAIAMIVAFVIACVLTVVLGFDEKSADKALDEVVEEETEIEKTVVQTAISETFVSPLEGEVVPLANIEDAVFSSGAMGKGVAIQPTAGKLYAPVDGEIALLFPTGHAIGMKTENGTELLIHIGMDTVELEGEGFTTHIQQGDSVTKGQLLVEFDMDFIASKGKPTVTPVVVTNSADYTNILVSEVETISVGEHLITVEK